MYVWYIGVCENVLAPMCTRFTLCPIPLRQDLPENLEQASAIRLLSLLPTALCERPDLISVGVLSCQTPIFILAQQALLPTEPSPKAQNFCTLVRPCGSHGAAGRPHLPGTPMGIKDNRVLLLLDHAPLSFSHQPLSALLQFLPVPESLHSSCCFLEGSTPAPSAHSLQLHFTLLVYLTRLTF